VVVVAFAWLAWSRRWIADDGLIVVRTVRELLAGNGPSYNGFERAEADTSTLWTYLVALVAFVSRGDVARVAVAVGVVASVAAVAVSLDASRRLQLALGATEVLVPCGVLVMIGAFPFWDYATSGLENGLVLLWLAGTWWLLVELASPRRLYLSAFAFGLGPLVRPELGVATIVLLVAAWLIVRPSRRDTLALAATAAALPCAYEIFRAGYYGVLVPLPALAKSASAAHWSRGLAYLVDFARPYLLYVPLAALAVVLGVAIARRRGIDARLRIAIVAPIVTGVLLATYVVRVGGDFMHARMALAPLFSLVLPAAVLPLRRRTAPVIAVLAVWAIAVAVWRDDQHSHVTGAWLEDERVGYVTRTGRAHPTEARWFVHADRPASTIAANDLMLGRRRVLSDDTRFDAPMRADIPGPLVYIAGRLGTGGAVAPIDAIAADTLGLANPLGAHITETSPGMAGHEKRLPDEWLVADFVERHAEPAFVETAPVAAARHAMTCSALAELFDSVRAPMTPSRFWQNLVGSLARTRLEVPADPERAELSFCGYTPRARAFASSSYEAYGWSIEHAIDGRASTPDDEGFSSDVGRPTQHGEWIAVWLPAAIPIDHVVLVPGNTHGEGFPLDVSIQVWTASGWVERAAARDIPAPGLAPQRYSWATPDVTNLVRIVAPRLREVAGDYVLQLAEIEL
jgi:arabinofuranosyltransferase